MNEQEAIVARTEGHTAVIELTGSNQGCGGCQEGGICQSRLVSRCLDLRPRQFRLDNTIGAVAGDRVIVQLAEGTVLTAALLAYFLPTCLLIAGAGTGAVLNPQSDLSMALGAAAGVAVSALLQFVFNKSLSKRASSPTLRPIAMNRIVRES